MNKQEFLDRLVALINEGTESDIFSKLTMMNQNSYRCISCINCNEHTGAVFFSFKENETKETG